MTRRHDKMPLAECASARWSGGLAGPVLLDHLDGCGRPVRYVAAPISAYGTVRYDRTLDRLTTTSDHYVVGAAGLFSSTPHWREWWPSILERLAAVSVLGAMDGTIGRGVWVEVRDADQRGLPIRWEGPGRRRLIYAADLAVIHGGASLRRYAALRARAAR